ncbi:serine hydrolase domain-containing protein [Microcoleus asticus]|uniref:serine hydrolase domain-containing protein n=1 Tax=Microcoleus asticus TaxID=2815231 RepID=UPI0030D944FC
MTQDYLSKRENLALTIGVVDQGHHYIKGFGKLSNTDPAVPNAGTIYEIGSVTEVFTLTFLAKLVNDGNVELDAPIRLYLPVEVINQLNPAVQSITLQQLATHTSGLPRLPDRFLAEIKNYSNPYLHYTAQEMYADLAEITLLSEPGQSYEYSNLGIGLLGHLLSLKTSQAYEKLVTEIICQPLGMTDTAIHLTPQQQQCLAPGHSPDGMLTSKWDFEVMPARAFRSTSENLLKFLQANLSTANTQMAAIFARSQSQYFEGTKTFSMGLNWLISTLPNEQVLYWHNSLSG